MIGVHGRHGIEQVGGRAAGWLFASALSLVAGVAGTIAVAALIAAGGSGGRISFAVGCAFGLLSVTALLVGRRVRPPRRDVGRMPQLPQPDLEDYSGLPSPSIKDMEGASFAPVAGGFSLLATVFLFPPGIVAAGVGGCLGSTGLVAVGLAIAGLGPVIGAMTWVFRG